MARKRLAPVMVDLARAQVAPIIDELVSDTRLSSAREVAIDQVVPDPGQPRRHMDEDALRELQESVAREGILQPLLVREDGVTPDGRVRYVVIAGARRLRAAQAAGLIRLPVVVRSVEDARELRVLQLVENLQREDLDPIEEAVALRELMELRDLSTREAGELIHRSHMHVQRRLDLLFDDRIVSAVRAGRVNSSVAAEIKSMPDAIRETYVARAAAGEPLDVAALREAKRQARAVIWGEWPGRGEDPTVTNRYSRVGARAVPEDDGPALPSGDRPREEIRPDPDRFGPQAADPADAAPQPVEASGRGDAPPPESDTSAAREWARELAATLLDTAGPAARRATIADALRAWRDAGAPNWWGVALLHTLAGQIDPPGHAGPDGASGESGGPTGGRRERARGRGRSAGGAPTAH